MSWKHSKIVFHVIKVNCIIWGKLLLNAGQLNLCRKCNVHHLNFASRDLKTFRFRKTACPHTNLCSSSLRSAAPCSLMQNHNSWSVLFRSTFGKMKERSQHLKRLAGCYRLNYSPVCKGWMEDVGMDWLKMSHTCAIELYICLHVKWESMWGINHNVFLSAVFVVVLNWAGWCKVTQRSELDSVRL